MSKTGKILASTVGVAAAAGVTLAALRKMEGLPRLGSSGETVYHVTARGSNGWEVRSEASDEPAGRHETKRDALEQARDLAHQAAPSRLVIHRADGTIQRQHTYSDPAA
jgi:hypothetical protein